MAILAILYFLGNFQVCREWAFICENTGSRKGHIEWFFGKRTAYWYEQSVFEDFMQKNYPDINIEHRWTSYTGTGRNIFGMALLDGHGRPGVIMDIPPEMLDEWIQTSEPERVRELYELMVSDKTEDVKKQRIDEIVEEVFKHIEKQ